jgi:hypothetical protein
MQNKITTGISRSQPGISIHSGAQNGFIILKLILAKCKNLLIQQPTIE